MKYLKKFESSQNTISEIRDNLKNLLYDFKDIGCEYVILEESGDDGIVYSLVVVIYPPNFSTHSEVFLDRPINTGNYNYISHGNPYSDVYVGDDVIDKSINYLNIQNEFNSSFQSLIGRIKSEYNITFIKIRPEEYKIAVSV